MHDVQIKRITPGTVFTSLLVLLIFSCAPGPPHVVHPPDTDVVTASWYGPKFHGRPTASGEKFNMYAFTCAHKKFPFGTRLRVNYLKTGKTVTVTVNDRGPFIRGRDLDLSYAAAKEIGLIAQGVGKVKIWYLGRDVRYQKRIDSSFSLPLKGPFTIQVGSFTNESNARRLAQGLKVRHRDVYITTTYLEGRTYYRVRIGSFKSKDRAYQFAKGLAEEGYSILIMRKNS
jgi:rare lipoprotein A